MRIKRLTQLVEALFVFLVAAMLLSVIMLTSALRKASERIQTGNAIVQAASDLTFLSTDYLIFPESMHRQRWEAKYAEFTALISSLDRGAAGQVAEGLDLQTKAGFLRKVFDDIGANPENRVSGGEYALKPDALRLAWSRVATQTVGMVSDGLQMVRRFRAERDRAIRWESSLVLAMVAAFVAFFSISCAVLMRRTLRSIAAMQAGVAIIGGGDLKHRIDVRQDDELGDLAKAFNRMTEEARKRTEEREAIAAELREHRENLELEIAERTEALLDAKREAEEANRLKSSFLANMSHELRTPLNSIIGFTEVLQDALYGDVNEKQREYLGYIATGGRHLLELINDILDLAKIESGKMDVVMAPFRLRGALELSLTMLRERALRHSISLSLSLSPEADLEVVSDEHKLKQILFNFLSNAVKFTPDGGAVRVEARLSASRDLVEVSVSDTGIGIKRDDMGRLFKEFAQLESPLEKRYEGTGLGLALSKRLIESVGGRIWAESEAGKGSTFSISFPLAPAERPDQTEAGGESDG
ncbi:MAG TPA: ATP-binding protein [Rectinemataceae bacterium]|nr:ATP-binding protein [Rectinemataceae bacterium]